MLQLANRTPFHPSINVLPDRTGVDTLFVVVRASFALKPGANPEPLQPAAEQSPPQLTDEHYGDPTCSSVRYASDVHVGKPGTDVALIGHARAAKPVDSMLVSLSVGARHKVVRVHGDRTWSTSGGASSPIPFTEMPLVWERAFGGSQALASGELVAEERNPVGVGFRGHRSELEMLGTPLPNIEDPASLLSSPGDRGVPAGFGFIAPSWKPRRDLAGTYDEVWRRTRAPYLPDDLDPRFFCAATPELVFTSPLHGGEPIEVIGAQAEGPLSFTLPAWDLLATVRIAGRVERRPFQLETVLLEPDRERVGVTYRAAFGCDKAALRVEVVVVDAAPRP